MRRSSMAVFRMAGAAVVAMSFARLARLMKSTSHSAVAEAPDVNRVSELADQLAARILAAIESGELTYWHRPGDRARSDARRSRAAVRQRTDR